MSSFNTYFTAISSSHHSYKTKGEPVLLEAMCCTINHLFSLFFHTYYCYHFLQSERSALIFPSFPNAPHPLPPNHKCESEPGNNIILSVLYICLITVFNCNIFTIKTNAKKRFIVHQTSLKLLLCYSQRKTSVNTPLMETFMCL